MGEIRTNPDYATEYLSKDDLRGAVLSISGDIEQILFYKLVYEKNINPVLIESWGISQLLKWNAKHDLISQGDFDFLNDEFRPLRNAVAHERVFIERIEKNEKKKEALKRIVQKAIAFIENTPAKFTSLKMEDGVIRYHARKDKYFEKFGDKKN
jgi:hypothetical protein